MTSARHATNTTHNTRPWWRRKRIIIPTILTAIILIAAASSDNKTPAATPISIPAAATSSTPATTITPAAPTATAVTANALIAAFDDNQVIAERKWSGRTVRVTGRVINVADDVLGDRYVALGNSDGRVTLASIKCVLADPEDAVKVTNRTTGVVTGKIKDQTIGVITLTGCRVTR